jgi:hypothetical protein
VRAGETFVLTNQGVDNHLWVVVSDPAVNQDRVLLLSITTLAAHKEQICPVGSSDHPWVRHPSCVSYEHAKIVSLSNLLSLRVAGQFRVDTPVSPELLERIRKGVADSTRIPMECAEVLEEQGLIDI